MRPRPQRGKGEGRPRWAGRSSRCGGVPGRVATRGGARGGRCAARGDRGGGGVPEVDTVRSRAALVRPCCSDYAPPHTSCISCPGLQAALRFLPECLRRSRRLDHRGNTGGGGGSTRERRARRHAEGQRGDVVPPSAPVKVAHLNHPFQAQVAALLTEPDPSGRSFAPGVPNLPSVLAADYVEEVAGWPDGAEVGRLLLLHLSTAPRVQSLFELTNSKPTPKTALVWPCGTGSRGPGGSLH